MSDMPKFQLEDLDINIPNELFELYLDMDYEELSEEIDYLSSQLSIDDILDIKFGAIVALSSIMGLSRRTKNYFTLSGLAAIMYLKYKFTGIDMTIPLIRRLGFKSETELYHEIALLMYLRGDFDEIVDEASVELGRS